MPGILSSTPSGTKSPSVDHPNDLKDVLKSAVTPMSQAFAALIIASMGFMAALAWNDAAKNLFEHSGLKKFTRMGPLAYAAIATIVAFLVSKALSKYSAPVCTVICDKSIKELASALTSAHAPSSPPSMPTPPPQTMTTGQVPFHTHALLAW